MNISRQNAVSASWMTPAVLALACSLLGALIFEFSKKQNDGAADTTKTKSTKSDGEKAGEIPAAEARVEGKVTANSSAVTPMEKQATESRRTGR